MPRNLTTLLFLILLVVVFLAGLRAQTVGAVFGNDLHIGGQAMAAAREPALTGVAGAVGEPRAACAPLPTEDLQMPGSDSVYILGLEALSAGRVAQAQAYFTQAVAQQEHPLALVFLANMSAEPAEATIYPGRWTDEMRLDLVEYYLTVAGRCQIAGEKEAAHENLVRGEAFLLPGGIDRLSLGVARAAGAIYLDKQEWAAALPWLEHAAEANDASLLRLAYAYYQLGRLEQATATYEQALVYYPQHATTRLRAAQVWVERNDIPAALAILDGMAEPLDLGVEGLLLWAEMCAQTADTTCQETQYQRVLTLDPQNETATAGLQSLQP